MKFTVVWLPATWNNLSNLWLEAADRQDVSDASDWFDVQLATNPRSKATPIDDLFFVRRDPLIVLCEISESDRIVTVIEVHRSDVS